jgi:hypothetical protein
MNEKETYVTCGFLNYLHILLDTLKWKAENPAGYPVSGFQISQISGQISIRCIPIGEIRKNFMKLVTLSPREIKGNQNPSKDLITGIIFFSNNHNFLEGTESDAEWAARALEKRTEVRNFRSDIKKEEA